MEAMYPKSVRCEYPAGDQIPDDMYEMARYVGDQMAQHGRAPTCIVFYTTAVYVYSEHRTGMHSRCQPWNQTERV